ncbi:hypothetical protein BJY00DRAFT_282404, partial [Aspergillus carlsbadensis]
MKLGIGSFGGLVFSSNSFLSGLSQFSLESPGRRSSVVVFLYLMYYIIILSIFLICFRPVYKQYTVHIEFI